MEDFFTAQAEASLGTWVDWVQLLGWFAGLMATFALTWWSTRRLVVALAVRLHWQALVATVGAIVGLVLAGGVLALSPMAVGVTLIAAGLALVLAAAGIGFSLVGYDHSSQYADAVATGAPIVDLAGRADAGAVR